MASFWFFSIEKRYLKDCEMYFFLSQVLRENRWRTVLLMRQRKRKKLLGVLVWGWGLDLDRRLMTNITEPSLAILAFVCVTFILVYTKTIAVPFVLAFFLYSALVPLLNWFVAKFKLPRIVVIGIFVVMGPLILLGLILPLIKSVESVFSDVDLYRERLTSLATSFSAWVTHKIPLLSMVKWKSSNLWTKIPYENLAHYLTDFVINFFVYLTLMFIFLFFMIIGGTGIGQKRD